MANHSVVEHRANYHFLKIEEDYVAICAQGKESPYCKALILATLEHWMNAKLEKGQDDFIYMTYPQWVSSVYDFFKRNVIIKCLAELVEERLILKRPHRIKVGERTKESFAYKLNLKTVQDRIKGLPNKDEKSSRLKKDASDNKPVEKETRLETNGNDVEGVYKKTATPLKPFKKGRIIDNTNIDTSNIDSFSTPEEVSCSQTLSQPTPEKKEGPSMSDWLAELDAKMDALDQQYMADSSRLQEKHNNQSSEQPTQSLLSQEAATLPAKPAPIAVYTPEPAAPRIQTPAQIAKERKEIERHIWKLLDTEAGAKIGRVFVQPMADLVTSYMDGEYVDDDFIQSVRLVRKQNSKMTFTNIVNGMADAVTERKKIIQFPAANKLKSFEEREAERIAAEQEFEARQKAAREARLAREAQGRMTMA